MRRRRLLAALFLCCAFLPHSAQARDRDPEPGTEPFTLYLVRHAEKGENGDGDPGLTEAGRGRAARLAKWLRPRKLEAVWSSDFRRSRETARPVAEGSTLPLRIYDVDDLEGFAGQLLAEGRNALVVGHSNTSPELARLLCGCAVAPISESEYDRIWRITVRGGAVTLDRLDQRTITLRDY
ncbi:MAG: phosphoglycerate mutase family protein [Gammaproteobacteria bacterium]